MSTQTKILSRNSLSDKDFQRFSFEFQQKQRTMLSTYLLWFFFGMIGAHEMYLHDRKWLKIRYIGLVLLVTFFIFGSSGEGDMAVWAGLTGTILLILGVKTLLDVLFIPETVTRRNREIEEEIVSELKGLDLKKARLEVAEAKRKPLA